MYAQVEIGRVQEKWRIKERALIGFTPAQMEKHRTAQRMLELVVNSWEFRQELLGLVFSSTTKKNTEIYKLIINGAETRSPEIDHEADIEIEAYRKRGSVVGYTTPASDRVFLNLNFFDTYNYAQIANNLLHEWLHKLGFDHRSAKDNQSVPYSTGKLVEILIKRMMNGEKLHDVNDADKEIDIVLGSTIPSTPLEPELVCYRSWRTFFMKKCYFSL